MKHLIDFKLFESSNFYDSANEEKIVKYLQTKLDFITGKSKQDMNLSSLIYNFIMRSSGKENKNLEDFAKKTKTGFDNVINSLLNYKENPILKFYPNPDKENMQWLEAKFNRSGNKQDKTYNYYLTFNQTPENLIKFFNSISKLVTKFYKHCQSNRNFECGFKFGSESSYYTIEKDHLKFYYYDSKNKEELLKLINEWLTENNILTEKRPYDHAIDTKDSSGKKTSFGDIASQTISKELEKLMMTHKDKFTPKQYFDWLIKFMSEAKYNIIEK
jgi:hypothetical protein